MRSSLLFGGALLAAAASAAPAPVLVTDVVIEYVTDIVTAGVPHPTAAPVAPAPAPVVPKPAPAPANQGGAMIQHAAPKPVVAPQPVVKPQPVTAPQPSSSSSVTPVSYSGHGPVPGNADDPAHQAAVIKKWRGAYALQELAYAPVVQQNADETGAANYGHTEIHHLQEGIAMGQCITPGQINPTGNTYGYSGFEIAWIIWLCEVPSQEPLQPENNDGLDICVIFPHLLDMNYHHDTRHNAILTDDSYNGFACAYTANPAVDQQTGLYQGIFTCNLCTT